jgi:hypothetical protein
MEDSIAVFIAVIGIAVFGGWVAWRTRGQR